MFKHYLLWQWEVFLSGKKYRKKIILTSTGGQNQPVERLITNYSTSKKCDSIYWSAWDYKNIFWRLNLTYGTCYYELQQMQEMWSDTESTEYKAKSCWQDGERHCEWTTGNRFKWTYKRERLKRWKMDKKTSGLHKWGQFGEYKLLTPKHENSWLC